ncbi:protein of unknown function [Parapedobacter composti]|uniref:DUF4142 domain-containing protein n=1 Tax=Parapedobacter composti TaxID=623281 RepID=A0A1I1M7Z1_9SPHI|nr:DUF4142 domain-containing protein [Parapedobacter composti]SFC81511.1 protein of unknown function [Parapedobacter composti]
MKFKKASLIPSLALAVALGSCTRHAGEPVSRRVLYNNETAVDTEGYVFLKTAHEKAVYETELAKHVQSTQAPATAKALASQLIATYEKMIPELESLAEANFVVLPDPGMPGFSVPHHVGTDSVANFNGDAYMEYVRHEQGAVLEQFKRASRNTSKELRAYAAERLPEVKALYTQAGGQEDHGAHH